MSDLRIGDYNTDEQIVVDTHLFEDDITAKEYLKRKKMLSSFFLTAFPQRSVYCLSFSLFV